MGRAPDLAAALIKTGWDVHLVATPSAAAWIDDAALVQAAGHTPTTGYRAPGEPRRGGRPDAVVVAPATFNTVNKLAAGLADTYAHGLLCDALGTATPLVIVPMVNNRLWGHPVWTANLEALSAAGVRFVDIRSGNTDPSPVPVRHGKPGRRRLRPAVGRPGSRRGRTEVLALTASPHPHPSPTPVARPAAGRASRCAPPLANPDLDGDDVGVRAPNLALHALMCAPGQPAHGRACRRGPVRAAGPPGHR